MGYNFKQRTCSAKAWVLMVIAIASFASESARNAMENSASLTDVSSYLLVTLALACVAAYVGDWCFAHGRSLFRKSKKPTS